MKENEFLLELLKSGENKEVEFKKSKKEIPKDLWESYSAFANSDGGIIVLGVSEEEGKFIVTGVENPDSLLKQFWDTINNPSKVNRNILKDSDVQVITFKDKNIIRINVPRGKYFEKPITTNENPLLGTYKRNHSGDYRCTKEEVFSMIRNASISLDNIPLENFTFEEDIDLKTFKGYRNNYNILKPNHPWSQLEDRDFLEKIGGIDKDVRSGKKWITIAALLMFGNFNSIRRIFPNYFLDYTEKNLLSNVRWEDRIIYDGSWGEGNLFNFYFVIINKLYKNVKKPFQIASDGYTRIDETSGHVAIREALVNALVHADFKEDSSLKILLFPDRIEFFNPGLLRISKEEIFNGGHSSPRNSNVMNMFNFINLCERSGSGVPKILAAAKEYNWNEPLMEENRSLRMVKFVLYTESLKNIGKVSEGIGEYRRVSESIGDQRETILKVLHEKGNIKRSEVEEILKVKEARARRILQSLLGEGLIEKYGGSSNTEYRFKEKISK